MSRPWMPLYIGDYHRDTTHFTTLQHGAYMLLIMHYWTHGGLPTDDAALARVCRMNVRQWESNCQALAERFLPGWRHKRIDEELEKARTISEKRSLAGFNGGKASKGKTNLGRHVVQAIAKQAGDISQRRITTTETVSAKGLSDEGGSDTPCASGSTSPISASPKLSHLVRARGWA